MLTASTLATLYADRWGRRASIIVGGACLVVCMYIIGSIYAVKNTLDGGDAGRWVVVVCIFLFTMVYVSTWGTVGKIYVSEIQPATTRGAANSVAQGVNFVSQFACLAWTAIAEPANVLSVQATNWLVVFATPIFLARSAYGAYFFFGSLSCFTTVVIIMWMPETRGKSLETIQDLFVPTSSTKSKIQQLPAPVHVFTIQSWPTQESPMIQILL